MNILDVACILNYLYKDGPPPIPYLAGDTNGSGTLNVMDLSYLVDYLYRGGSPPDCYYQ